MAVQPLCEIAPATMAATEGFSWMAAKLTPSNVVTPSLEGLPAATAGAATDPALAASGERGIATERDEKRTIESRHSMSKVRRSII